MSDEILVCAVPSHYGLDQVCGWPDGRIPYALGGVLQDLGAAAMVSAMAEVWAHIASECGVQPRYTEVANQSRIYTTVGPIDGPSGTLAWAELPCGNITRSTQKYDTGERKWVVFPNGPPPQGTIDWWRVYLHETCHSLGLPHGGADIMAPMYSPNIYRIGDWTRAELRKRYGPPVPVTPVPPIPPQPPAGQRTRIVLEVDGIVTGARVISIAPVLPVETEV